MLELCDRHSLAGAATGSANSPGLARVHTTFAVDAARAWLSSDEMHALCLFPSHLDAVDMVALHGLSSVHP